MRGRIHRATEEDRQRYARVPEVGRIRIGVKEQRQKAGGQTVEFPRAVDYFVAAPGKYRELFRAAFGEEPRSLPICFFSDERSAVCSEQYECRDESGRLLAEGDGDNDFRIFQPDHAAPGGGRYVDGTKEDLTAAVREYKTRTGKAPTWRAALTLRFFLVHPRINVLGYWQLKTHAETTSIPNIVGVWDRVHESVGDLIVRVPFDLTIDMHVSQKPGAKNRYPVLNLVPHLSQQNLEMARQLADSGETLRGILTGESIQMLAAPQKILEEK